MRGASINNQEDRAFGTYEQSFEKLDKDTRIHTARFLDHEPHMAFRGDHRDQAHAVTGACCLDNRRLTFLAPGAPCMMIGTDMRRIAKIDVRALDLGHRLDLWVLR